jgi:hypothetical protein
MTTPTNNSGIVLRAMYAAEAEYLAAGGPGAASFDTLAPFFASDVVLHQAEGLPYGGIWRGHDGMERFFLAMADARATGQDLDFPILQSIRVVDRRITEVRPFYWDTAAIAAACDVAPPTGR